MRVVGILPMKKLLIANQRKELLRWGSAWSNNIPEAKTWISKNIKDKLTFFENINEVEFDGVEFFVSDWSDFYADNDSDGFRITDYMNYMMCELLLEAISANDPNLNRYYEIFNGIEDIKIEDNNIEIDIYYKSTYKGSGVINIDYGEIADKISQMKQTFPMINIKTYLGMS